MLGMLSNPLVTLLWLMEQVDVHVLGATPRASDIRIVLSFCVNSAIVIGMYFLYNNSGNAQNAIILGVILAWVSSHNKLANFGILQPFNKLNEKLQAQKEYSDIAFKQSPAARQPILIAS